MKAEVRKNYNTDTQTNENVRNYQIVQSTISYTEDPTLRHIPLEEALPRLRAAIHKQKSHKMVHLAQLWVLPFYFVLLHTQNTQYLILPSSIFEISEKTLFSKLPFSKGFIRQHKANCFPSFSFTLIACYETIPMNAFNKQTTFTCIASNYRTFRFTSSSG